MSGYKYHYQRGGTCTCTHGAQEHLKRASCLHSDKDTSDCACKAYVEDRFPPPPPPAKRKHIRATLWLTKAMIEDSAAKTTMLRSQAAMGNQNARKKA
jgi:hypothetical protein